MIIDECNFLNPDIYAELLNSSCFLHDDNDDDDDGDDEEDKQDEKDEKDEDDNDNYYEYESDQCEEGDDGGGGGELWDVDTTPLLPRPSDVVTTAIDAAMLISDHRQRRQRRRQRRQEQQQPLATNGRGMFIISPPGKRKRP